MSSEELDQISLLRAENERLKEQYAKIVNAAQMVLERGIENERLQEECRQKNADLEHQKAILRCRDEVMKGMEEDISILNQKLEAEKKTYLTEVAECKRCIGELENNLSSKEAELQARNDEMETLKNQLAAKEADRFATDQFSVSYDSSLVSKGELLEDENVRLKEELDRLREAQESCLLQLETLESEVVELRFKLRNQLQANEEAVDMYNGCKQQVEDYKRQIEDLNNELLKARTEKMSKKGNSMFSEFVDERLKLEKDLIKLKAQNDALLAQKQTQDQEIDNLRQELILALSVHPTDSVGGNTLELQKEIWALRAEIESLKQSGFKLDNEVDENRDVPQSTAAAPRSSLFLQEACAALREENKVLKRKLSESQKDRIAYFDRLSESENKRKIESGKVRKLEMEVLTLGKKLRREEQRNLASKVPKEDKEKMIEKIADVRSNVDLRSSILSTFNTSAPSTSAVSHATEIGKGSESGIQETGNGSTNGDSLHATSQTPTASPSKRKTPTWDESLPLEKRVKHVQFSEDVVIHSVGSNSALKINPIGRRNVRKARSKVLQADPNGENPECKQQ